MIIKLIIIGVVFIIIPFAILAFIWNVEKYSQLRRVVSCVIAAGALVLSLLVVATFLLGLEG